jgi:hypothetical protein
LVVGNGEAVTGISSGVALVDEGSKDEQIAGDTQIVKDVGG